MTLLRFSPLPLLLALVLFAALAAPVGAAEPKPRTPPRTLTAEWFKGVNIGRPSNRTTVVRITAVAMALALFIMFRSKH